MAFVSEVDTTKSKATNTSIVTGKVFITAGFNNTIISISDSNGDVIAVSSSGAHGFRGSRKATPYAATIATEAAAKKAYQKGMREVSVFVKGPGSGRTAAVKALKSAGLSVVSIADVTGIPHNGCRPKNRRRV